jgi:benzoate/toluate 1,2-dioxygenase subunit beta
MIEGEAKPVDYRRIEQFLYREARLADEHRLREWLSLCTSDMIYWVPAGQDDPDPSRQVSIIYDDRKRLEDRIGYLETGALNVDTKSRMRRMLANIEIESVSKDEYLTSSNFSLVEIRGEHRYTWCGRTLHRLRDDAGALKMCMKKVLLVDNEQVIPVFQFLL